MDYVNQDVICPKCGQCIAFDDFDDCYDTEYDACGGIFIERCAYTCPICGKEEITAEIYYEMKFKKVVQ